MAAGQMLNGGWCLLSFASSSSPDPMQAGGDAPLQTHSKYKFSDDGRKVPKLFAFLLCFSVLPLGILVAEVSTGSRFSIDSNGAVRIVLVSHHHLFLKALISINQHTVLVPSDPVIFSPVLVTEPASSSVLLFGLPIIHSAARISPNVDHSRWTRCSF